MYILYKGGVILQERVKKRPNFWVVSANDGKISYLCTRQMAHKQTKAQTQR